LVPCYANRSIRFIHPQLLLCVYTEGFGDFRTTRAALPGYRAAIASEICHFIAVRLSVIIYYIQITVYVLCLAKEQATWEASSGCGYPNTRFPIRQPRVLETRTPRLAIYCCTCSHCFKIPLTIQNYTECTVITSIIQDRSARHVSNGVRKFQYDGACWTCSQQLLVSTRSTTRARCHAHGDFKWSPDRLSPILGTALHSSQAIFDPLHASRPTPCCGAVLLPYFAAGPSLAGDVADVHTVHPPSFFQATRFRKLDPVAG
jgi:hypothetical protein